MPQYLTLDDVDVNGLDVLVRSDLNVPMEEGVITDDFRIRAATAHPGASRRLGCPGERLLAPRSPGRR